MWLFPNGVLGPIGIDGVVIRVGDVIGIEARSASKLRHVTLLFLLVESIFRAQVCRVEESGAAKASIRPHAIKYHLRTKPHQLERLLEDY